MKDAKKKEGEEPSAAGDKTKWEMCERTNKDSWNCRM